MDYPTYVVRPLGIGNAKLLVKESFKRLVKKLKFLGYFPRLRLKADRYSITIMKKPKQKAVNYNRNIYLFAATAATIFLDGYLRSNNPILLKILMPGLSVFQNALLFTLAILAIFGLHEFGHKAVSMIRGVEASMPYFIPAPPGMGGTFGAVITQREPPMNRDALFDLGLSGPLIGFLVTVIVTVIGLRLSFVVSVEEVTEWMAMFPEISFQSIPFPLLIDYLSRLIKPSPEGAVLILHPVGFAAWVGCIVTFLNLIPSWQLDGGHISRALLGKSKHKFVSMVGIALMILSGYFIMAVMIAFFMTRKEDEAGGLLDDVSPLSTSRNLLTVVYIAMGILPFVALLPF